MSKIALSGDSSGTGTFTIASPNSNSNFTLTLPSADGTLVTNAAGSVSQAMLASGVAGTGPACSVTLSSPQSISSGVYTKIGLNSELFDTNNNFNTSNNRFLPTVAGYYQISAQVSISVGSVVGTVALQVQKNGSSILEAFQTIANVGNAYMPAGNKLVYMNGTTDYLEFFAFQNSGVSCNAAAGESVTFFSAALVRAA